MGLALKLLVGLDMAPKERAILETTQKSQRMWGNLEAFVTSIVHRKRTALGGSELFTLTKKEADSVAEYLKYVQESAGRLLWRELCPDNQTATPTVGIPTDAMQNRAPVTPVANPTGSASSGTGGPPLLTPPGMLDLPTFDRKSLCSALEIVIKGVDKMTADEVRLAVEARLGQNTGLAHLHVIDGKNVGFARFWSAESASRALEELKGLITHGTADDSPSKGVHSRNAITKKRKNVESSLETKDRSSSRATGKPAGKGRSGGGHVGARPSKRGVPDATRSGGRSRGGSNGGPEWLGTRGGAKQKQNKEYKRQEEQENNKKDKKEKEGRRSDRRTKTRSKTRSPTKEKKEAAEESSEEETVIRIKTVKKKSKYNQ